MIRLGFNEFIRNIRKNSLVIVQMVAVYMIALFTTSAFVEQYRLIDGVRKVFDDTGMIMFKYSLNNADPIYDSELAGKLKKVEAIEHSLRWDMLNESYSEGTNELKYATVIAVNRENITYLPQLLEGKWCDDVKEEQGLINAVISNDFPFEVEVGQVIEHNGYKFKVIGIVASDELLYGINSGFGFESASYLDFYSTWGTEKKSSGDHLFIIPYESMVEDIIEKHGADAGLDSLWGSFATIDFEDDITEEEMEYNRDILQSEYSREMRGDIFYTNDMYDYSWVLINIKIMPMVMLLIVIILALVISLVISASINVLYEKKNYGIYFICGNNWSNTFKFSFVSWAILALTSMIIAFCGYVIIGSLELFSGLSLTFSWMHIAMLALITVVLLIVTMIIPFCMLRKIQPVSILKENNK